MPAGPRIYLSLPLMWLLSMPAYAQGPAYTGRITTVMMDPPSFEEPSSSENYLFDPATVGRYTSTSPQPLSSLPGGTGDDVSYRAGNPQAVPSYGEITNVVDGFHSRTGGDAEVNGYAEIDISGLDTPYEDRNINVPADFGLTRTAPDDILTDVEPNASSLIRTFNFE